MLRHPGLNPRACQAWVEGIHATKLGFGLIDKSIFQNDDTM
jgi:hypothetical protein